MNIKVYLTEKEILEKSNDFDLGQYVRNKYWQERRNMEGPPVDDEHFFINVDENGLVTSIKRPWKCSICGEDTSKVEYDYLVGYDHLSCTLKQENDTFDKCVICGKESPYRYSTHIDHRVGYVEGGGQGCFQPNVCKK